MDTAIVARLRQGFEEDVGLRRAFLYHLSRELPIRIIAAVVYPYRRQQTLKLGVAIIKSPIDLVGIAWEPKGTHFVEVPKRAPEKEDPVFQLAETLTLQIYEEDFNGMTLRIPLIPNKGKK
jgi:hypothetical protein